MKEEEVYYLPNQVIEEYEEMRQRLEEEVKSENKRHYELRKECAYK